MEYRTECSEKNRVIPHKSGKNRSLEQKEDDVQSRYESSRFARLFVPGKVNAVAVGSAPFDLVQIGAVACLETASI